MRHYCAYGKDHIHRWELIQNALMAAKFIQTYPYATYGSTLRSMLMVALLTLRKTPLKICLKRRSCKILRVLGCMALILHSTFDNNQHLSVAIESTTNETRAIPTDADHKQKLGLWAHIETTL